MFAARFSVALLLGASAALAMPVCKPLNQTQTSVPGYTIASPTASATGYSTSASASVTPSSTVSTPGYPTATPTPAKQCQDLQFMIIGDWGNAGAGQNNTAALMKTVAGQNNISMVLSLGDNFYSNSLDSAESYEGVKSSTDPKWTDLWQNMYLSGPLSTVPWWSVAGNHDWYGALGANPDADVQHSQVDSRWIMPDFFWDKTVTVNGFTVGFVFVDTDLLFYGYQDVNSKKFGANFVNHGWTAGNNSIQQHLDTIEGYLKAHQNDDYLIVIGHHPLGTCSPTGNMTLLENLLATYQPSAYMFGHTHAMQFNRHHNTMYIQSGTGGNAEAACNMTGVEQWAIGSNYGFALGTIDCDDEREFRVQYYITGNSSIDATVDPVYANGGLVNEVSAPPRHGYIQPDARDLEFLIIGDWGNAGAGQNNTAALMKTVAGQNNISMVLSLGDNFYSNSLDSAESYEGVKSSTDPKWTDLWQNMYLSGPLSTVPWWSVAGNHDWYGALGANPDADVQHSQVDSRWIMPDFFWDKTVNVAGLVVGFVFIETDLLNYGYQDVNSKKFGANFVNHGWTAANNSIQQHLDIIEGYLKAHQNDDFLIVVGHHPLGTCAPTGNMTLLENLLATYQPSAYMFGHTHAMQFDRHHNTMYIQSGTGGNAEAACSMVGVEQWAIGNNYGFAKGTIDVSDQVFRVQYYITGNSSIDATVDPVYANGGLVKEVSAPIRPKQP